MAKVVAFVTVSLVVILPCCAYSSFLFRTLTNSGLSGAFWVASEADCLANCTGNTACRAVSYSKYKQSCVTSFCAHLMLDNDALSITFVKNDLQHEVSGCSYPRPYLEWIMTDSCGLENYGTTAPGLLMIEQRNFQPVVPQYMPSKSAVMGQALYFPGLTGYYTRTASSSLYPDLSKPYTIFAYLWAYVAPASGFVNILEFGNITSTGSYLTCLHAQMWPWPTINIDLVGSKTTCSGTTCIFSCSNVNVLLGAWNYVAFVYDAAGTLKMYLNGAKVCSDFVVNGVGSVSSQFTCNTVSIVSRPNSGGLNGSIYCVKMFSAALSLPQITAVANSCVNGAVTLL